jgi:hypothetical protein
LPAAISLAVVARPSPGGAFICPDERADPLHRERIGPAEGRRTRSLVPHVERRGRRAGHHKTAPAGPPGGRRTRALLPRRAPARPGRAPIARSSVRSCTASTSRWLPAACDPVGCRKSGVLSGLAQWRHLHERLHRRLTQTSRSSDTWPPWRLFVQNGHRPVREGEQKASVRGGGRTPEHCTKGNRGPVH